MLYRMNLDLAFKDEADLKVIIDAIKRVKAKAVKINVGEVNEEDTTRAFWHKCYHDEGLPCEQEVNI